MSALAEPAEETSQVALGIDEPMGRLICLDAAKRLRAVRPAAPQPVRVLIADGQALVRAGFKALLEGHGAVSVVAEAASGDEAIELAEELSPEVVLLDIGLPGLDCVETTRRIRAASSAEVMLLIGSETDERSFAALRAGACGLLVKDTDPDELVRAVRLLARGQALLSPGLTRRLITELASRPEPELPDLELVGDLTDREREVVALVALGLNNGEIAERLVVTPATARTHVSRAMIKLHARDRAQLVVMAYESGLAHSRSALTVPTSAFGS